MNDCFVYDQEVINIMNHLACALKSSCFIARLYCEVSIIDLIKRAKNKEVDFCHYVYPDKKEEQLLSCTLSYPPPVIDYGAFYRRTAAYSIIATQNSSFIAEAFPPAAYKPWQYGLAHPYLVAIAANRKATHIPTCLHSAFINDIIDDDTRELICDKNISSLQAVCLQHRNMPRLIEITKKAILSSFMKWRVALLYLLNNELLMLSVELRHIPCYKIAGCNQIIIPYIIIRPHFILDLCRNKYDIKSIKVDKVQQFFAEYDLHATVLDIEYAMECVRDLPAHVRQYRKRKHAADEVKTNDATSSLNIHSTFEESLCQAYHDNDLIMTSVLK